MNNIFCLNSARLLNKPKIKAQVWHFANKHTNMNKHFIKSSLGFLWTDWFIYNSKLNYFTPYLWDILKTPCIDYFTHHPWDILITPFTNSTMDDFFFFLCYKFYMEFYILSRITLKNRNNFIIIIIIIIIIKGICYCVIT